MHKIWELFDQLDTLLESKHDIKTWQEIVVLSERLADNANYYLKQEKNELKYSKPFFNDVDNSSYLYGQCGDNVYWKIINRVLHIIGTGPMWNFDNTVYASGLYFKDGVFVPWRNKDFDSVVIGNGVTTIEVSAFEEARISNIVIPSSVKKIETIAFFNAKIETLVLPETLDTIEQDILCGFSSCVDTLVVSVNIPNIKERAFFNGNYPLAKRIILTGELPEDLTQLINSRLFDNANRCKIYYPQDWDNAGATFYERLAPMLYDEGEKFLTELINSLIPMETP